MPHTEKFPEFVEKISDLFDETPASALAPETRFKELSDWSSIVALSLIAVVADEYGVVLDGKTILASATLGELLEQIISRV